MRSVSAARKPQRSPRAKAGRRGASPARVTEREASNQRKKSSGNFLSHFFSALIAKLTPSRPMLFISGSLLALTVLMILIIGGYIRGAIDSINGTASAVALDAGFGIKTISISGNQRVSPQSVRQMLALRDDAPIFGFDLDKAQKRVMSLPWVAGADVSLRYPDALDVRITEKLPFALWEASDGLHVIDRTGAPITFARRSDYPHLPLFTGDAPSGGSDIVEAVALHRAISSRVVAMQRVSGRRWNLLLAGQVLVKLPEDGWQKQLDVLEHLIVDKGVLERDVAEIDLRSADNYFLTLRTSQQQPSGGNGI